MKVTAEHLSMDFNDAGRVIEVFQDLSFEVESGRSIAIVGESGVGKTTLLYVLGALEKANSGDVYIGDTSFSEVERCGGDLAVFRGKHIGFVFQSYYLLPEFDAVENVAMPLYIQGSDRRVARKRAVDLLSRTGLGERLNHRPAELSGGEQQRVAIARAFAASPGLVLADEPTGNLDVHTGAQVGHLLKELQEEEKITLIVVTHSLDLARMMDRVIELTPKGLIER